MLSNAGKKRFWNLVRHQNVPAEEAIFSAHHKWSDLKNAGIAQGNRNMPDWRGANNYPDVFRPTKIQKTQPNTSNFQYQNSNNQPAPEQKQPVSEQQVPEKPKIDVYSLVEIHNAQTMSEDEMKKIHDALLLEIFKFETGTGPRFSGFSHRSGIVVVTCDNYESQAWLAKTIKEIKPWPEADLFVKFKEPAMTVVTFVPNAEADTVEKALKLIQIQNKGLHTEMWKVLNEKEYDGGRVLTLALDYFSVENLKQRKYKAILGFKNIYMKVMSTQSEEAGAADANKSEEMKVEEDQSDHGQEQECGQDQVELLDQEPDASADQEEPNSLQAEYEDY